MLLVLVLHGMIVELIWLPISADRMSLFCKEEALFVISYINCICSMIVELSKRIRVSTLSPHTFIESVHTALDRCVVALFLMIETSGVDVTS